ncbi:MAG: hypothetical protein A3G23_09165 [Bacteroidetes bacterium RIFCSPLOWO2_12_FULL_37_12]|nr:MAG: hypothetical protein A3G23_09165 [Bacteroidetes bacterium RIFCSPLOWO2_12_FULL_37_12]
MLKKISLTQLGIIFVILLGSVFIIEYFFTGTKSSTLQGVEINFDPATVTEMRMYPRSEKGQQEIRVIKENNEWKLILPKDKNKKVAADAEKINNAFGELKKISAERLVSDDESQWNEYQVTDTNGTRVELMENSKKVLDIIIGKFSFKNQREFSTYFRMKSDKRVFITPAFLDMTFNREVNTWRNGKVINSESDNWKKVSLEYPDSSFTLTKDKNKWNMSLSMNDSSKTTTYLRDIQHFTTEEFVDDIDANSLGKPQYTLTIESSIEPKIEVKAFPHAVHEWLITSSQNPGAVFKSKPTGAISTLFISPKKLYPAADTTKKN